MPKCLKDRYEMRRLSVVEFHSEMAVLKIQVCFIFMGFVANRLVLLDF